ncbi:hypothetical protein STEG23_014374, partial [Scotinomys teguina]
MTKKGKMRLQGTEVLSLQRQRELMQFSEMEIGVKVPSLIFFIAKTMGQQEDTHQNQTKEDIDDSLTTLNGDVQSEKQVALLSALELLTLTQQTPRNPDF